MCPALASCYCWDCACFRAQKKAPNGKIPEEAVGDDVLLTEGLDGNNGKQNNYDNSSQIHTLRFCVVILHYKSFFN